MLNECCQFMQPPYQLVMYRPIKLPRTQVQADGEAKSKQSKTMETPKPKGHSIATALESIVRRKEQPKGESPQKQEAQEPASPESPGRTFLTQQQFRQLVLDLKTKVAEAEEQRQVNELTIQQLESKNASLQAEAKALQEETQEIIAHKDQQIHHTVAKLEAREQEIQRLHEKDKQMRVQMEASSKELEKTKRDLGLQIERCQSELSSKYQYQIASLEAYNSQLANKMDPLRAEIDSLKAQLKLVSDLAREKQNTERDTSRQERILLQKVATLSERIKEYSQRVVQSDTEARVRLEDANKVIDALKRQLFSMEKKDGYQSQAELKNTIVKFQSSQALAIQLKSANLTLIKKNKELEDELQEANRKLGLLAYKNSSLLIQNKALKDKISEDHRKHTTEIAKKAEDLQILKKVVSEKARIGKSPKIQEPEFIKHKQGQTQIAQAKSAIRSLSRKQAGVGEQFQQVNS